MRSEVKFALLGDEAGPLLDHQIAAIRMLGWSFLELRSIQGCPIADLPLGAVRHAAVQLRMANIAVPVLASGIGGWGRTISTPLALDYQELEKLAERAPLLGAKALRVMSWENDGASDPEWQEAGILRLAAIADRAEEYSLELLHENCVGYAGSSADRTLKLLQAVNRPNVKLLFDIGNVAVAGTDPVEFLTRVVSHVRHVHVKDVVGHGSAARFVRVGSGVARVAECLMVLKRRGYDGLLTLEPHLFVAPHDGVTTAPEQAIGPVVDYAREFEILAARKLGRLRRGGD